MTHDVTLWNEATKQRAWPKIDEQVSELDRQIGVNKLGLRYFARFLPVYQQLPEFIVKNPSQGTQMDMWWIQHRYNEHDGVALPPIDTDEHSRLILDAARDAIAEAIRLKIGWLVELDKESANYDQKSPDHIKTIIEGAHNDTTLKWLSRFAVDMEARVRIFAQVCDSTRETIEKISAVVAAHFSVPTTNWPDQELAPSIMGNGRHRDPNISGYWPLSGTLYNEPKTTKINLAGGNISGEGPK